MATTPPPASLADLKARGWIAPLQSGAPARAAFPFGLGERGVHEIAEAAYGDAGAAAAFALAAMTGAPHSVLWVSELRRLNEHGRVCTQPGAVRLDVRVRRSDEALWAVEEAVVSGAVGLVVAELSQADFTATRRLVLASGRNGVPVILLLPWQAEGASASAVRWRVASKASAVNRYDPRAPGAARWRARLERCRPHPVLAGETFDLEWSDETLSLSVAAPLAAGSLAAPQPRAASG